MLSAAFVVILIMLQPVLVSVGRPWSDRLGGCPNTIRRQQAAAIVKGRAKLLRLCEPCAYVRVTRLQPSSHAARLPSLEGSCQRQREGKPRLHSSCVALPSRGVTRRAANRPSDDAATADQVVNPGNLGAVMIPGWSCRLSGAPREQYSVRGCDLARKVAARFPPRRWFATDRGDVEHVLGRYVDQVGDRKNVTAKNFSRELEATTRPRTGCSQRWCGEDREESSRWLVIPHSTILPRSTSKELLAYTSRRSSRTVSPY